MKARREVVREFLLQECVSIMSLVETKIDVISPAMANELMGASFDYVLLSSAGASGGIILGWDRNIWDGTHTVIRQFSVSASFAPTGGGGSDLVVLRGLWPGGRRPQV
jgi:hypothetical protein